MTELKRIAEECGRIMNRTADEALQDLIESLQYQSKHIDQILRDNVILPGDIEKAEKSFAELVKKELEG